GILLTPDEIGDERLRLERLIRRVPLADIAYFDLSGRFKRSQFWDRNSKRGSGAAGGQGFARHPKALLIVSEAHCKIWHQNALKVASVVECVGQMGAPAQRRHALQPAGASARILDDPTNCPRCETARKRALATLAYAN